MSIQPRVIYDKAYSDGLALRNEEKLRLAKEQLGTKWLLHPDNKIVKVKFKGQ